LAGEGRERQHGGLSGDSVQIVGSEKARGVVEV